MAGKGRGSRPAAKKPVVVDDVTNEVTQETTVEVSKVADETKTTVKVTLKNPYRLSHPCGTVINTGSSAQIPDDDWTQAQEAADLLNVER